MNEQSVALPQFAVYSRQGCHLCEVLIDELLPLLRDRAVLEIRDVDSRDDWREHYGHEIPVVELNGERLCHYTLDRAAVLAALQRVQAHRPVNP